MKQLLQILYNIRVASNVITFLKSDLPVLPVIDGIRDALETFPRLEENIDRCIISEDEMADNASPFAYAGSGQGQSAAIKRP